MALGGVPYYWRMLRRGMSPAQDFDELFFSPSGRLRREFDELYASLFKRKEPYVAIVTALGAKGGGLTRDELLAASGLADGGRTGRYLEELEECGGGVESDCHSQKGVTRFVVHAQGDSRSHGHGLAFGAQRLVQGGLGFRLLG